MTPTASVHLGNCLPWMRKMESKSVDVLLSDPPFSQRTSDGARGTVARDAWIGAPSRRIVTFDGISNRVIGTIVREGLRVSRRWVLFFCELEQIAAYQKAAGNAWIRAGIWNKPNGAPQVTGDRPAQGCEAVAIMHPAGRKRWNGGGTRAVWTHNTERDARRIGHPTPKPIPLMLELVSLFSDVGETILDPFTGSGGTGVAALRLGRSFRGAELDPAFHAIAVERLAAEARGSTLDASRAGQFALFGGVS